MNKLQQAARLVIDRWEKGDLSQAVRQLQQALDEDNDGIEVRPMVYEKKEYPFYIQAKKAGDSENGKPVYAELAVGIYDAKTDTCISDTYFLIDRETGEPKILQTMDGEGDGDKKLVLLPLRSVEEGVRDGNEG